MSITRTLHCGATLMLGLLTGCWGNPVACASFPQVFFVWVVDTAGSPVADAVVTSILTRTGDTLSSSSGPSPDGYYRTASEADIETFQHYEHLRVTASHTSGTLAEADYGFIRRPCEVAQVSGPDTLVLR